MDALLEHNPRSVAARLARSRFFNSAGDIRAASGEIDEALRIDPKDVDARLAAADAATRRDDPATARRHLDAIDPPRPDDLRVKILQGQVELVERKTDLAIRDWQDGLALANGGDAELTWRLAHVLIQLGRPREAAPLISQYRRLSGDENPSPACRYLIGLAMLKSGRTAEAIAELEAIRYKLDKGLEGPLYLALGQAYEASPDLAKAAEAYQRATASAGAGAAPWLALARLQAVDRPGDQIPTLERGIAAVGPDERLLAEFARALWRKQAALPADKRDWSELERALEQGARPRRDRSSSSWSGPTSRAPWAAPRTAWPSSRPRPAATRLPPRSGSPWPRRWPGLAGLTRRSPGSTRPSPRSATGPASGSPGHASPWAKGTPRPPGPPWPRTWSAVPADQRPALAKALGEFHMSRKDFAAARRAFLEWAAFLPESIDPHLTLLNLAIEAGDDRSVDLEVEALKAIGGPSSLYWKVARAESLLKDRPGSPLSPAMLDEASRLVAEIKASTPRRASGVLLEARLMERRGRLDEAIRAYEKAIELKAGPLAIKPLAALRARVGGSSPEAERMLAAKAREVLARTLVDPVERAKAREQATKAADAVDAPADLIRLAAALDLADGDLDAASRRVARLEALGLDDPATLELKARLLKAQGQAGRGRRRAGEGVRDRQRVAQLARVRPRARPPADRPERARGRRADGSQGGQAWPPGTGHAGRMARLPRAVRRGFGGL